MRHRRTDMRALILVVIAACGGGEPGLVPPPSTPSASTVTEGEATPTTNKPEVTLPSTPATTATTADGGHGGHETTSTTTSTPGGATTTTTSGSGTGGVVQVPESMLTAVIEDAASSQNIDIAAVTVISGQPVDWSDGSLGCPEPNKSYIQVITPGYLVLVDAGGVTLEYHLNQQGAFKQCTGGVYHPPSGY